VRAALTVVQVVAVVGAADGGAPVAAERRAVAADSAVALEAGGLLGAPLL
jgi:hypothetical protein